MGFLYSVIGFLLAIGILVTVHEFGHYWVAKKLGVKVLRFSIGFGKPLWKKVAGPDQTEYVLAAIPLGGYVKMLGENDPDFPADNSERHRAFDTQPIWKRSLIVAAGPGINFLFAILLFMFIALPDYQRLVPVFGELPQQSPLALAGVQDGDELLSINGKEYKYFSQHNLFIFNQVLQRKSLNIEVDSSGRRKTVTIETSDIPIYNINPGSLMSQLGFRPVSRPPTREIFKVTEDSPAQQAGLQAGDQFVSIDGHAIQRWNDLVDLVQPAAGKPLQLRMERDGVEFAATVTPKAVAIGDGKEVGLLGVQATLNPYQADQLITISNSPWQALLEGANETWLMSQTIVRVLGKMITLQISHKNVNGPIMIADVAGTVIQVGLEQYLTFLALISISLGVMNLLPIPLLDGGHLLRFAVELVAGKSLSEKFYFAIQPLGILMLFGLMSLAFYNDILRIFN